MPIMLDKRPARTGLSDCLRSHAHPGSIIACEERKFIYMKPGKTAGTSILRRDFEGRIPGIIFLKDYPEQIQEWLARITDEELEDYFIFTVVRNPWDRLVSIASYFNIPFNDLVHNLPKYWENDDVRTHSLPCHLYTHHHGVRFADMICRFECIQPDLNLVYDRLGIERRGLTHANRSNHAHYSRYYGDEEREIVGRVYAKDIEYFGYMFEQAEPEQPRGASSPYSHNGPRSLPKRVYRKLRRLLG